jgi:hypothetical protein
LTKGSKRNIIKVGMETKFKIGDRVKIVKSFDVYAYIGLPGTVTGTKDPYFDVSLQYEVQLDKSDVPSMLLYGWELDFFYDNALVRLKKRYKKE